jgi:hypothetical protein
MNGHEEFDARLQAQAELAERQGLPAGGHPAVDRYRLVMRALRQPLAVQLPADFAARVAAKIAFPEERSSFEDWAISLLLLGVGVAGLFYVQPLLAGVMDALQIAMPALPDVPWPLLGAAAASLAVAWVVDQGASRWKRDHGHPAL